MDPVLKSVLDATFVLMGFGITHMKTAGTSKEGAVPTKELNMNMELTTKMTVMTVFV